MREIYLRYAWIGCFLLIHCHTSSEDCQNLQSAYEAYQIQLSKDRNRFWEIPLEAPLLFVDPNSRITFAPSWEGTEPFTFENGCAQTVLPDSLLIANTSVSWLDTTWAMVMLPLPEEREKRNRLLIHESIHTVQPELGFANLPETSTKHLENEQPRIWLQLELKAVQAALTSEDMASRSTHIQNALNFRYQRHLDTAAAFAENQLELNEGIVEYTAIRLCGMSESEQIAYLSEEITNFFGTSSFLRTFAYLTLPSYGILLSKAQPQWHRSIDRETNLTSFLYDEFKHWPALTAKWDTSSWLPYDYLFIRNKEAIRTQQLAEKIAELKKQFVSNDPLILPLIQFNMSFDYQVIQSIPGVGTVYPQISLQDNWGSIEGQEGVLITEDWRFLHLSKPDHYSENEAEGPGWILTLKPDWVFVNTADSLFIQEKSAEWNQ